MDVDDPVLERFEKSPGVDAVVAGVDHDLDSVLLEEIPHRDIALFSRRESPLRQLAERNTPFAGEDRAATRWPVGRHGHHVETAFDQVAQVRPLAGDGDAQLQRMTTRSGPVCRVTSPTTRAPAGTSGGFITRIMPSPMLKVPYISSSAIRPRLRMRSKTGGAFHVFR